MLLAPQSKQFRADVSEIQSRYDRAYIKLKALIENPSNHKMLFNSVIGGFTISSGIFQADKMNLRHFKDSYEFFKLEKISSHLNGLCWHLCTHLLAMPRSKSDSSDKLHYP